MVFRKVGANSLKINILIKCEKLNSTSQPYDCILKFVFDSEIRQKVDDKKISMKKKLAKLGEKTKTIGIDNFCLAYFDKITKITIFRCNIG